MPPRTTEPVCDHRRLGEAQVIIERMAQFRGMAQAPQASLRTAIQRGVFEPFGD